MPLPRTSRMAPVLGCAVLLHCADASAELPVREVAYAKAKQEAKALRHRLHGQWQAKTSVQEKERFLDTVSAALARTLLERIVPPWYGTPWSFEGHSETPGSGSVACGYFVSTSLRDVGFRVDRFRLAQGSPVSEARSIAIDEAEVRLYRDSSHAGLAQVAARLPDGAYFVGLSNHVGFLRKDGRTIRFVHSDYVGRVVADQSVEDAVAFSGESLWVADLSGNRALARSWLEGRRLEVRP